MKTTSINTRKKNMACTWKQTLETPGKSIGQTVQEYVQNTSRIETQHLRRSPHKQKFLALLPKMVLPLSGLLRMQ